MCRLWSQTDLDTEIDLTALNKLFNPVELQFFTFYKIRGQLIGKAWVSNLVPYRGQGGNVNMWCLSG